VSDYPSEVTLEQIRTHSIEEESSLPALVASHWHYAERAAETSPGLWVFSTGGWSGNEDLLEAMQGSPAWWMLSWEALYLPGGLLIVAVTDAAKTKIRRLFGDITKWAWTAEVQEVENERT